MDLVIGTTRSLDGGYERYRIWLERFDPNISFLDLSTPIAAADLTAALNECAGVLFPGGPDIDPAFFGRAEARHLCRIDLKRDELELEVFRLTQKLNIPVLGVCRGLQVINVALGGTLEPDLPAIGIRGHARPHDTMPDHGDASSDPPVETDATHEVTIVEGTYLHDIMRMSKGIVNSSHHQAADMPAPGLRICARSADGVIEGLEWNDRASHPWMLLVQWHPERMREGDVFAESAGRAFVDRTKIEAQ
jgi:putative glutamine amidotransferase